MTAFNRPSPAREIRISADSHMGEPPDLWEKNLPARFRDQAPRFPDRPFETDHHLRAGCWDPHERLKDLALDGIAAEVLYPTLGVRSWLVGDQELEEACLRVYNDWMIDFCGVAPERFWGLAMLSLRDIDSAVKEMERCKLAGLRGVDIWLVPPEDLPYSSDHYERFWAAAQDMEMPLAMHISGRASPRKSVPGEGNFRQLHSVNGHKFDTMNALFHIIASGVLERHPRLKVVVAESGVGWIPFWLQELDYYTQARSPLPALPSEYFRRQVHATFISDPVGGYLLRDFGQDSFMWSNDYPHPACIWPDSSVVIPADLGHLPPETQEKVVWGNAARVFNSGNPPLPPDPLPDRAEVDVWLTGHPEFGGTSRLRNAQPAAH